jgi:hypothetical protein
MPAQLRSLWHEENGDAMSAPVKVFGCRPPEQAARFVRVSGRHPKTFTLPEHGKAAECIIFAPA